MLNANDVFSQYDLCALADKYIVAKSKTMKSRSEKFGAIGNWKKFDERFDETIVKQVNDASCVSAVGEMLANYYGLGISQKEILKNIGIWSNSFSLAKFLNSKETESNVEWISGGYAQIFEHIVILVRETQVWAALLRDGNAKGHAVLICGQDKNNFVEIKDPFDQTIYKMDIFELDGVLSELVFRRRKSQ